MDIVARLQARAANPVAADIIDDLCQEAATVIERLRINFIDECLILGYGEDQAKEMLAEVENGQL